MRVLNAKTYKIHEFLNEDEIKGYAILSHTWGDEECSLQQMTAPDVTSRKGYKKIKYCCEQALKDGFEWVWVDTCCIDKTSTAELSEAINSMFRWYRNATICYTYLADVATISEFSASRWFTRGWTLQELIAPKHIGFYSSDWQYLGSKTKLQDNLWKITGIDRTVLSTGVFEQICVAKRMSWAANRQTTRAEDRAYSLMGIFDVNMPLLYGEGKKAFTRLQEEIMKASDDHTLFAWGLPAKLVIKKEYYGLGGTEDPYRTLYNSSRLHGLLAESPADFVSNYEIQASNTLLSNNPPVLFNKGVRIDLAIVFTKFAAISCTISGYEDCYLAIPILNWNSRNVARCGDLVLIPASDWSLTANLIKSKRVLLVKKPVLGTAPFLGKIFKIMGTVLPSSSNSIYRKNLILDQVHCLHDVTYSPTSRELRLHTSRDGPYAALFFNLEFERGQRGPEFAFVVGSDEVSDPRVAFVPISGEGNTEKVSAKFSKQGLMTKSQLISQLNDGVNDIVFQKKQMIRRFEVRENWKESHQRGITTSWKSQTKGRKEDVDVVFKNAPVNVLQYGIIVCISLPRDSGNVPHWWQMNDQREMLISNAR